jgi:hypothetical protein
VKRDARTQSPPTDGFLFDTSDDLAHEPRLLVDGRLLGALHAEVRARQSGAEGNRTLFQLGFLHGLRDALRGAAQLGDRFRPGPAPSPAAPLLEITLGPRPRGTPRGETAMVGTWPAAEEACAHVSRLGRSTETACYVSAGYSAGWYSGLLERDLVAVERSCVARGDDACRFELRDALAWEERRDPCATALLADLSFAAFREAAAQRSEAASQAKTIEDASVPAAAREDEASVVHVWGPVMVLPFSNVEEALRGLELIGRDPAAQAVSVVVIDLTGAALDEAFDAAALEHVVNAVEGWGAEPVLAGVSTLSERAVADLAAQHILVHKDLASAIASAFQIAQVQGRTV